MRIIHKLQFMWPSQFQGSIEGIALLEKSGVKIKYVTNESSCTRRDLHQKLIRQANVIVHFCSVYNNLSIQWCIRNDEFSTDECQCTINGNTYLTIIENFKDTYHRAVSHFLYFIEKVLK